MLPSLDSLRADVVEADLRNGQTVAQVAREHHLPAAFVSLVVKDRNLDLPTLAAEGRLRVAIIQAVCRGKPAEVVARKHGLPVDRVREICQAAGVCIHKDVREAVVAAVRAGMRQKDAAFYYGVTAACVSQLCIRAGVKKRRGQLSPFKKGVWESVDWTRPDIEISRRLGVSRERIRQVRGERGMPPSPYAAKVAGILRVTPWLEEHKEAVPLLTLRQLAAFLPPRMLSTLGCCLKRQHLRCARPVALQALLTTQNLRCFAQVDETTGCWHWILRMAKGLPIVGNEAARPITWHLFHGPVPSGRRILPTCCSRRCINPDHLILETRNTIGLKPVDLPPGTLLMEPSGPPKPLTPIEVANIRRAILDGTESIVSIEARTGCTAIQVAKIAQGFAPPAARQYLADRED